MGAFAPIIPHQLKSANVEPLGFTHMSFSVGFRLSPGPFRRSMNTPSPCAYMIPLFRACPSLPYTDTHVPRCGMFSLFVILELIFYYLIRPVGLLDTIRRSC